MRAGRPSMWKTTQTLPSSSTWSGMTVLDIRLQRASRQGLVTVMRLPFAVTRMGPAFGAGWVTALYGGTQAFDMGGQQHGIPGMQQGMGIGQQTGWPGIPYGMGRG